MSVENKLVQKTVDITLPEPMRSSIERTGKLNVAAADLKRQLVANYVPVVMQHIRDHGCSGLKCKRCPLNNICDRDASKSKDLAAQVITYANINRMK